MVKLSLIQEQDTKNTFEKPKINSWYSKNLYITDRPYYPYHPKKWCDDESFRCNFHLLAILLKKFHFTLTKESSSVC